jgi:hypothetical protein
LTQGSIYRRLRKQPVREQSAMQGQRATDMSQEKLADIWPGVVAADPVS